VKVFRAQTNIVKANAKWFEQLNFNSHRTSRKTSN